MSKLLADCDTHNALDLQTSLLCYHLESSIILHLLIYPALLFMEWFYNWPYCAQLGISAQIVGSLIQHAIIIVIK